MSEDKPPEHHLSRSRYSVAVELNVQTSLWRWVVAIVLGLVATVEDVSKTADCE